MAGAVPEFDLDTRDLQSFGRDLRRMQGGRPSLTRYSADVKNVAERQMIPALRQRVKSLPSKGESRERGMKGLRDATANAIVLSFRVDNQHAATMIRVNPLKMPRPRFSGFLPSYMEGIPGFTTWKHPTFGNREVWSKQPATPWMQAVISRYTPEVMRAVEGNFERTTTQAVQGRRKGR